MPIYRATDLPGVRAFLQKLEDESAPTVLVCPRCGACGFVSAEEDGRFRVDWSRHDGWFPDWLEKADDWFDLGLTLADLNSPNTGCGYDLDENPGCFARTEGVN